MTSDVVVVGAGPTGLMLACELALCGSRPLVLERLPAPSDIPKANGLVGNVVQLLDCRGLLERFAAGSPFCGPVPAYEFGTLPMKLAKLGQSPLHVLLIPQSRLEQLLGERARELGVEIRRGQEVTGFTQDGEGVTLEVLGGSGQHSVRTRFLVGCDGARSFVRKHAGIGFPGTTSRTVSWIGHVTLPASVLVPGTGELELPGLGRLRPGRRRTAHGTFTFMSFQPGVHVISASEEREEAGDPDAPMTLEELAASVRRVLGVELPMSEPRWLRRVVGNSRQAERYRDGRVFLAGDAAHVFSTGGSALNVDLLDAVNLGWKLAATLQGWAPAGLLDSYEAERQLVCRRVLLHTRAQAALMASGEDAEALRTLFGELLEYEAPLRHVADAVHGADVRYDMGVEDAHPWVGRWAPELQLDTAQGARRTAEVLRRGRPVLIDLSGHQAAAGIAADWADRVDVIAARAEGTSPLTAALLIRPDGHVAWASGPGGEGTEGLEAALCRWFGARRAQRGTVLSPARM